MESNIARSVKYPESEQYWTDFGWILGYRLKGLLKFGTECIVDSMARQFPLTRPGTLHTEMKAIGQRLLDALAEEDWLYQPDLLDEDFEQWKAVREVVEQLAIDYTAIVHLYLQNIDNQQRH